MLTELELAVERSGPGFTGVNGRDAGDLRRGATEHARWVLAVAPDPAECARLESEYGVPLEFAQHALDPYERPRVDSEGPATLVIFRAPVERTGADEVPHVTIPLGLVLAPHQIVTIVGEASAVGEVLKQVHREHGACRPRRLLLLILRGLAEEFQQHLAAIAAKVDVIEDRLRDSQQNSEVLELLRYQKGLVYLQTALRADELMLERLQTSDILHVGPEDHELLQDVLVEVREAIDVSKVQSDILANMMDAFASIISNNLNVVMKFLAAFTIVLTFPMMLATLYGMNVALPGGQSPGAFWSLLGVGVVLGLCVALYFRRRGWL